MTARRMVLAAAAVVVFVVATGSPAGAHYKPQPGERVGVLLCGANVDLSKLAELG